MARISQVLVILFLTLVSATFAQDGTNYNAGDHGRSETVSADGEVQGQYQYTDPEGKLITVKYRAGKDGFQVEGDHLPRAPQPIPPPQQQPQQYQSGQYQPQPQQYQSGQYQQPQQHESGQYQPQQYESGQYQPQQYQPQQQQPQLHPFANNQQPAQAQQPSIFQNFGQNQFQNHPNALPGQQQQQQPQFYNNNGNQQQQQRPNKVSVSQDGAGFSYTFES